ncbi:MAG TPA: DUF1343 domain-containing protein [Thermoanaerobaculia bacterium]|nr:DUF1343 domain-containing protein [Thermoanaerobaculia bacterium]
MITTGLDRLLRDPAALVGRPYGLLSHAAALTSTPRTIVEALAASAAGAPRRLFSPEHGFWGVEQDMVPSRSERDPFFGIETISLYGSSEASLKPSPEAFDGLEVLLVDLQDIGNRIYTYAATAVWMAEAALAENVEVWVLDRPNPVGGERVEGNLRRDGFESFVSAFRLPALHGLTLGELVRLEAARRRWDVTGLRVLELGGWNREAPDAAGPGWRWRSPSPNMPTPATAWVFTGSVLIEATELSEGRGTTRPFELVGSPGLPGAELARRMNELRLPGVVYLPVQFRPQFQKHAGCVCSGVEIVVIDTIEFPSYRAGIELLRRVHEVDPAALRWREAPYEFVSDRPAIDLLTGGDDFRTLLEAGGDLDGWIASWSRDELAFLAEREPVLLYGGGRSAAH